MRRDLPKYWTLLDQTDKLAYTSMRQLLSSSDFRNRRDHSVHVSQTILSTIRTYAIRNDAKDGIRAMVCGICWLDDLVAVNTRQLRISFLRCKASINLMFQILGYQTIPATAAITQQLEAAMPIIRQHKRELRHWTFRAKMEREEGSSDETQTVSERWAW
jgi:hypothetical protein